MMLFYIYIVFNGKITTDSDIWDPHFDVIALQKSFNCKYMCDKRMDYAFCLSPHMEEFLKNGDPII